MEIPSLKLHPEESEKIQVVLSSLVAGFSSASACLISRSGQEVAFEGVDSLGDRQALASLAAGNLAATSGLAQLIDECEFSRIVQQGRKRSMILMPVGELALLLLILGNERENREGLKQVPHVLLLLKDLLEKRNHVGGNGTKSTDSETDE
ncbi:MAG: roadblock/LC7 domain-containing protein [Acidobacteriota bacterium]|nr:MAG: roadblock/LC7 domain-containing protein [Acidobacteriota bacterium]